MAQRIIKLPGVHELTKDQELARALPLEGQHLIIGGPGTGKSVVALLRLQQLVDEKKSYVFLVYNLLLKHTCFLLGGATLVIEQWQGWFRRLYMSTFNTRDLPRKEKEPGQKYADFNWNEILHNIRQRGPLINSEALPYIVIDEGQDMPPEFYQALAELGYENFFVVADQNQQIREGQNSSRQDIQNALAIESNEVLELITNHRNDYSIARVAREFYTGDPASPPPKLPEAPRHNVLKPLLFNHNENQFDAICERITVMAQSFPSSLIGVLTPENTRRKKFYAVLNNKSARLGVDGPLVTTYEHGFAENLPFEQGGVMVINAQACKGLEFDYVFIVDIDKYKATDLAHLKKLFYVMSSRARERLFFLSEEKANYDAYTLMPTNTDILEIK